MHETLISIEGLDPVVLLGNENSNLRALQDKFPKLRIVARGNDFIIFKMSNGGGVGDHT